MCCVPFLLHFNIASAVTKIWKQYAAHMHVKIHDSKWLCVKWSSEMLSFTHPCVLWILYDLPSSVEHKKKNYEFQAFSIQRKWMYHGCQAQFMTRISVNNETFQPVSLHKAIEWLQYIVHESCGTLLWYFKCLRLTALSHHSLSLYRKIIIFIIFLLYHSRWEKSHTNLENHKG